MMYHCMPIDFRSPLDAKSFENVCHTELHELIDHREKHAKKRYRGDDHPGRRDHVFAARPGDLLHLHANVVQEFPRAGDRAGNFFADAGRCSGDGVALRFFVLHFDRLRGHESSFSTVGQTFLPVLIYLRPQCERPNSGRGGGIRTPIPGFGDRSPSRWTTPLNSKPACPSPLRKQKATSLPCVPFACGTCCRTSSSPTARCASFYSSTSCSCGCCNRRTAT